MKELSKFNPWWIEEPTNPDDILVMQKLLNLINLLKLLQENIVIIELCLNN